MLDKEKIIKEIKNSLESEISSPLINKLYYEVKKGLFDFPVNKDESCIWKLELPNRYLPYYKTSCGKHYNNPYQNKNEGTYCQFCGKPIKEVRGE